MSFLGRQVCRGLLLCALVTPVRADQLLLVRSHQAFPEAMASLQAGIARRGYKVTRVQNVDIGLSHTGYRTDNYKVVFYGKPEEVAQLTAQHPELIPYLPLNLAIFAEGEDTLLVTSRPGVLADFFPDPPCDPCSPAGKRISSRSWTRYGKGPNRVPGRWP